MKINKNASLRRKTRIRAKIALVSDRPRLSVHRSNKHIYAQIIDDKSNCTLAYASDVSKKNPIKGTKAHRSEIVGEEIAKLAIKAGVKEVVFDRGNKAYHGRIKILAESARLAGLKF